MKRILLISSLVLAFIITGCSDKANVEADQNAVNSSESADSRDYVNDNSTMNGDTSDSSMDYTSSSYGSSSGNSNNNLRSVYFKFDKFNVDSENMSIVKSNAKLIVENAYREVRVEGNTDEWGSDEYNYALALKRASAVKDALMNNDIAVSSIKLVSYGESKPKCIEKTKECWQENRRVDFITTK